MPSCLGGRGAGLETPEAAWYYGSRNAWLLDLTVATAVFMFTVFARPPDVEAETPNTLAT